MDEQELITVLTTYDANTAEIVRIALENEGIKCAIENEGQAAFTGVFEIKVMVRAEDQGRARKLVDGHLAGEE